MRNRVLSAGAVSMGLGGKIESQAQVVDLRPNTDQQTVINTMLPAPVFLR